MRWRKHALPVDYPGAVSDLFRLIAWVVGLLFVIVLLWAATETEIARDEQERRKVAMQQAFALANGYSAQLRHLAA